MHACRCAHALDVVPSDETTLSKLPLLYREYMHSSLTRANFTNMIPWYGRLSQRPLFCTGANHSYQHINTGGKKAVQHTLWSINLQDREIDEHTTAYAQHGKRLLDERNQYMLRCTPQSEGASSLMIERYTSMESVRDTVSPIIYPFKSLSKLISNTQIPSPPSTPDTHTSRPSATSHCSSGISVRSWGL